MTKALNTEQIENFRRDGFLAPVAVFGEDEAAKARGKLEAAEETWPGSLAAANRNNGHLVYGFLDALAHDPRLLDVIEDLIGPDFLATTSVLFIKEPQHEGFISWHQDGTYMGLEPDDGVTAWIALTESNLENGCMAMIPSSHTGGIRPHHDRFRDNNLLTRGQEIEGVDKGCAEPLILKPGEVSFHHSRTIHGSQPNRSTDRRIGFAVQSFVRPEVRQVKAEGFAQHGRGRTDRSTMTLLPRAQADMAPDDVARRDRVNAVLADILYDGAERRRNY
ncbi:MAG: phytanoyl-CoA dioxygenase [Rhodospirillaceae bacterium]|nr:phytanoyl-CoA dioxygenase [Rhodospirillaceae bacterium]|tara:strand:- start:663 stop:1493 length:831 start_codon:yes stop_codon:yes gene_type:complete